MFNNRSGNGVNLKELQDQLDALTIKTEEVQATPEGIELEKKIKNNPNHKIEGRFIPGHLLSNQNFRMDAKAWATLFPNSTPEQLFAKFNDESAIQKPKTPQVKK